MTSSEDRNAHWSDLMAKAQKGDKAAYQQLLREIQKVLLAFIKSRLPDTTSAEDIVQDILIGIHNSRHTYDPSKSFSTWMFSIARYKFIDHARKWARTDKRHVDGEEILETIAAESDQEEESPLKDELLEAVSKLPEKQRKTVTLLKLEGFSVKEVSQKTGMSESAVKVTAHRAYKTLRKKLAWLRT